MSPLHQLCIRSGALVEISVIIATQILSNAPIALTLHTTFLTTFILLKESAIKTVPVQLLATVTIVNFAILFVQNA